MRFVPMSPRVDLGAKSRFPAKKASLSKEDLESRNRHSFHSIIPFQPTQTATNKEMATPQEKMQASLLEAMKTMLSKAGMQNMTTSNMLFASPETSSTRRLANGITVIDDD